MYARVRLYLRESSGGGREKEMSLRLNLEEFVASWICRGLFGNGARMRCAGVSWSFFFVSVSVVLVVSGISLLRWIYVSWRFVHRVETVA